VGNQTVVFLCMTKQYRCNN